MPQWFYDVTYNPLAADLIGNAFGAAIAVGAGIWLGRRTK